MIEPLQLLIVPPKLLESIIFALSIVTLNKKIKIQGINSETQLSRLFLIGVTGWFIYITLDALIYVIAPLSMGSYTSYGVYEGYNFSYPSLLIANILRDIGMAGSLVFNWIIFITAFFILYGQKSTNKKIIQNKMVMILIIIISAVLIISDQIQVNYNNPGTLHVSANWHGFGGFSLALIILQFSFSIFFLLRNLSRSKQSIHELSPSLNQKIQFLSIGVIIMLCGHLYWLFLGRFYSYLSNIINTTARTVIVYWIGHLFWMSAGIFIYLSVKKVDYPSSTK